MIHLVFGTRDVAKATASRYLSRKVEALRIAEVEASKKVDRLIDEAHFEFARLVEIRGSLAGILAEARKAGIEVHKADSQ